MKRHDIYAPARWDFPKETEFYIQCTSGKEIIRERATSKNDQDLTQLVAEFPLYGKPNDSEARRTWKLAKHLAKEVLKSSVYDGVVVCHREPSENIGRTYDAICVYSKFAVATPSLRAPKREPDKFAIQFFAEDRTYTDATEEFSKEEILARAATATDEVNTHPEIYTGWELLRWNRRFTSWMPLADADCRYDTGRRSRGEQILESCRHEPVFPYDIEYAAKENALLCQLGTEAEK